MRRLACGLAVVAIVAAPVTARAEHATGHPDWSCCPALARFADDVPELLDAEWGYPVGGWGGIRRGAPLNRTPVIFVHGNGEDASFWDLDNESTLAVNVRERFRADGYTDQEMWALSYNGARCGNNTCQTSNEVNVADMVAFIETVLDYTGAQEVDIVAHSLGVTLVRRALQVRPDLQARVEDAVFASGANHGTTACRGSETIIGCHEIYPGSPWLAALNDGDETPGATRYMTVCDCTGAVDHFFLGPDARSPQLDGAENLEVPGSAHFVTARGPDVYGRYLSFVKQGGPRAVVRGTRRQPSPSGRASLPATGIPAPATAAAVAMLLAASMTAVVARRSARA